jgi:hypothetical protein
MATIAIIKFSDLGPSDENPSGCASAYRFTYNCHKCDRFRKRMAGSASMQETYDKLKCKPFIAGGMWERLSGYFEAKKVYNEALELLKKSGAELE